MRKFKCIKSFVDYLTKDKIYKVEDDEIIFDNGNKSRFLLDGGTIAFVPILNYLVEITDNKQEKENNMKFKVGDRVRIIGNCNQHEFKIGEIVVLKSEWDGISIFNVNGYGFRAEREIGTTGSYNIVRTRDLELVTESQQQSKNLTISISNTTTTLSDGQHTTTINRYNGDKHDERKALKYVVEKYYSEIERVSKMPKEKYLRNHMNVDYGIVGAPTILTDSIGTKLFIGDIVKVYEKDGTYIDTNYVVNFSDYGDCIMGCVSLTSNNSKEDFNYLKVNSYTEIGNDGVWKSDYLEVK